MRAENIDEIIDEEPKLLYFKAGPSKLTGPKFMVLAKRKLGLDYVGPIINLKDFLYVYEFEGKNERVVFMTDFDTETSQRLTIVKALGDSEIVDKMKDYLQKYL